MSSRYSLRVIAGPVACLLLVTTLVGCAKDWKAFRHNAQRDAHQARASKLSDPAQVTTLHVATGWPFHPPGAQAFRASPIVHKGRVYVGNGNGRFYAVDAVSGALLWQYPPLASQPLTSTFTCNPSSFGIASSAAMAKIGGTEAVIFAAPDRSIGTGAGSGRLFALDAATGAEIWKSPEIAVLNTAPGSLQHEQLGYSAPLVFNNHVYIGVANHCDNPIQRGKVVAVHLATGAIDPAFSFFGAGPPRGGGVWSSVAGWDTGVFATTGNTNIGLPEPPNNHGLSMLRLDRDTGSIAWKLQPVPFVLDGDPDWSAGAAVMSASCGTLVASTMKDGWTYAVNAGGGSPGPPSVRWQFPPTGLPFTPGDGTVHGDTRYLRPGAAWGDVFITMAGGLNVTTNIGAGLRRLHALNACAPNSHRVRWIADVPGSCTGTPTGQDYCLGPPTVSRGMVFVGTTTGQLVVIADPSLAPAVGFRCSDPDVPNGICALIGALVPGSMLRLVPEPAVLAQVTLSGAILTEPVLVRGRVYVATSAGNLYMLEP
jgi:outer membrane protein assembly factor BamB